MARAHRLPEKLAYYIKVRKLKHKDIAPHIDVHPYTIGRWLSGDSEPGATALSRLADLFQCTVDELLGREVPKDRPEWTQLTVLEFQQRSEEQGEQEEAQEGVEPSWVGVTHLPIPNASRALVLPADWTPTVPWVDPGDLLFLAPPDQDPRPLDPIVLTDATVGYFRYMEPRPSGESIVVLETLRGAVRSSAKILGVIVGQLRRELPSHRSLVVPEGPVVGPELVRYLASELDLPDKLLQDLLDIAVRLRRSGLSEVVSRKSEAPDDHLQWWSQIKSYRRNEGSHTE